MLNSENTQTEVNIDNDIIENDHHIQNNEQSYDEHDTKDAENEEKESRFKDGETLNMVRVRFPGNARSFPFFIGKRRFAYGQKVVAMSDRGMTVGYINSFPYEVNFNKGMLPIRSIAKVAAEEDIKAQKDFRNSEKKAEVICLNLIERHKLDMVLTHVEFIQFGKKAVFYFNAPDRVDFRELVKDLVGDLKMRIELRQISVRDRAAALGSVGACGLQTCCSSFLKNYGNVSIKMAKNQNLALIPSKLNGVCGQIKCCIRYEDDVYADKRKVLPKEATIIKTINGDIGRVQKLHLLIEQFEMLTDFGAKRRYSANQFNPDFSLSENYKFPETFDHIVDETKEVIGLKKEEQLMRNRFLAESEQATDADLPEEEYFAESDLSDDENDDLEVVNEIEVTKPIQVSNNQNRDQRNNSQNNRPQRNFDNKRNQQPNQRTDQRGDQRPDQKTDSNDNKTNHVADQSNNRPPHKDQRPQGNGNRNQNRNKHFNRNRNQQNNKPAGGPPPANRSSNNGGSDKQ